MPAAVEYDSDSDNPPHVCTLPSRGRKGNSNLTCPVDPCNPMQHILNEYYRSTYEWHAPKQGIALMINSGTQICPINLDRLLIEHSIIMGVEHVMAVTASLYQEVCNHRAEHAGFLIHGKHGLPLMYLTIYSTCIPLIAAFVECHQN